MTNSILLTVKEKLHTLHLMQLFFLLSMFFFINSCSLMQATKPIEVVSIAKMPTIYDPPLPIELQLVDIDWTIYTPELMAQYLKDIENGDAPRQAFYSLTTKEYENLSMNMADQKRYLKEILSIIGYYRQIDEPKKVQEPN
tara:strand:+ start:625 stop:1047 length:423 start_codon:yes stop_codon:yes gene_type:complete